MKFYLMVAQLMVFRSQIYNFLKHLINLIRLISIIGFTAKLEKTHAQKRIAALRILGPIYKQTIAHDEAGSYAKWENYQGGGRELLYTDVTSCDICA